MMLYTKLVDETEGVMKWRTLTWYGNRKKAPETPPMDEKKETAKATSGGRNIQVCTPDTGNSTYKKSIPPTRQEAAANGGYENQK